MKYEEFEYKLGTWAEKFRPFIESEKMDRIYQTLKEEVREGKKVFPLSSDTFKAFEKCDYSKLNCLILSYCPYHTTHKGIPIADGMAFSSSKAGVVPPSLDILYNAMEKDLCKGELNLVIDKRPDLSYLAEQGVLLLNSALTVVENKAGGHQKVWQDFTTYFIEEILDVYTRGIPVIVMGGEAAKFAPSIIPFVHHIKKVEHPAAVLYKGGNEWKHDNCFSWVNTIIEQNNGKEECIKWFNELK